MSTETIDSTITSDEVAEGLDAASQQFTEMVVANPMPSVLAAAATGAALMALIALMTRSRSVSVSVPDMPDVPMPDVSMPKFKVPKFSMPKFSMPDIPTPSVPSSMPDLDSLKDQLADLVKRVAGAFPSKDDAKQKMQDANDAAQSTWSTVRDQASDVIDQLQPQITAATKVARENPLWAALIAGAIGTVLGAQFLGKSDSKG